MRDANVVRTEVVCHFFRGGCGFHLNLNETFHTALLLSTYDEMPPLTRNAAPDLARLITNFKLYILVQKIPYLARSPMRTIYPPELTTDHRRVQVLAVAGPSTISATTGRFSASTATDDVQGSQTERELLLALAEGFGRGRRVAGGRQRLWEDVHGK
ncbi:hypothetical protein BU15DRAFT_61695 [Melanogaster broomeanus]|nr:hypothetical protein BU15DRAFT_61695 [Melanogaster broomeanus]